MEVEEDEEETIAAQISKFVLRFVDRVGTEAGIKSEHLKSLYAMIPGGCIAVNMYKLYWVATDLENLG